MTLKSCPMSMQDPLLSQARVCQHSGTLRPAPALEKGWSRCAARVHGGRMWMAGPGLLLHGSISWDVGTSRSPCARLRSKDRAAGGGGAGAHEGPSSAKESALAHAPATGAAESPGLGWESSRAASVVGSFGGEHPHMSGSSDEAGAVWSSRGVVNFRVQRSYWKCDFLRLLYCVLFDQGQGSGGSRDSSHGDGEGTALPC